MITILDSWENKTSKIKLFEELARRNANLLEKSWFLFSPDESKVLYQAGNDFQTKKSFYPTKLLAPQPKKKKEKVKKVQWYVYDLREDKTFLLLTMKKILKLAVPLFHLLLIKEGEVAVEDYDGKVRTTVYAGPFDNGFVFPPSAKGLLILTSLNTDYTPNLYSINFY